jgi:trk system potassium uptake protein TrkA
VVREGNLFVPHGGDHLLTGDDAYFIAPNDQVERTLKIFGHEERQARRVIIAGGGNIGLYVAKRLEELQSATRLKLIETDRERAVSIAEQLDRTVVLHGSALDEEVLKEADVSKADTMVALTNDDQVNILSCIMSNRLGCARSLCLLNNAGYSAMVRSLGIDASINPRGITVSRVLQHVRRGRIRAVHSIQNGAGEVIEAEALETSPLVGKPLREIDLPDGMRIGAILRNGEIHIPDGDTQIGAHDRVIMFVTAENVHEVEQMFRVSLEFF